MRYGEARTLSKTLDLKPSAWKEVAQIGPMGCGVACVASRLGLQYEDAKKLFGDTAKDESSGYSRRELVDVLNRSLPGKKYAFRPLRGGSASDGWRARWSLIPVGAIVCVRRYEGDRWLHYLLHAEKGWMDPWANWDSKKTKKKGSTPKIGRWRKKLPREWRPLSIVAPAAREPNAKQPV